MTMWIIHMIMLIFLILRIKFPHCFYRNRGTRDLSQYQMLTFIESCAWTAAAWSQYPFMTFFLLKSPASFGTKFTKIGEDESHDK